MPTGVNVVRMWPSVNVNNSWILFVWVEINGHYHAVIEVGLSICGLNGSAFILWNCITFPWIFGSKVTCTLCILGVYNGYIARDFGRRIAVYQIFARSAKLCRMPAFAIFVNMCALARIHIYWENIALYRVTFVRENNNGVFFVIKSNHVFDNPRTWCKLFELLSIFIK